MIQPFGVSPSAVVGHSLGEYAALNVAGVPGVSDALFLVGRRALLLQERCERETHAMLAVKASRYTVARLLAGTVYEIACVDGLDDTVISGENEQIGAARAIITKSVLLKVPFAFHSARVTPILESFRLLLAQSSISLQPLFSVLSLGRSLLVKAFSARPIEPDAVASQ